MRTVTGPTDQVVIVGAGLGGLACALRLAGAGRQVTVLERADGPGGRMGQLAVDGYRFDTGPTVLTMPDLLDETLQAVGERMPDWLDLVRLDPAYRAHFADGSTLDIRADTADTAAEIARLCGPREADGFLRFAEYARKLYRLEWKRFIDRDFDHPWDIVGPDLARLAAVGGFRRLSGKVSQFLDDPRTQRVFSFQSLYAGVPPHRAAALYAVIAYMDTVAGVYLPARRHARGRHRAGRGRRQARRADRLRPRGHQRRGQRITRACGAHPGRRSHPGRRRGAQSRPAGGVPGPAEPAAAPPAALLALVCRHAPRGRESFPGVSHHNIHFGQAWRSTFDDITRRGRVMSDPSLLVTNPTRTDPGLAPQGREVYYVLAPAPNTQAGLDWPRIGEAYTDDLLRVLAGRGYPGLDAAVDVRQVVTPADWARQGLAAGTPFAAAHTFAQSGPLRPGNLAPGLENVVFVGSGTRPGVGIPMVLVSARLAAERIGPSRGQEGR